MTTKSKNLISRIIKKINLGAAFANDTATEDGFKIGDQVYRLDGDGIKAFATPKSR